MTPEQRKIKARLDAVDRAHARHSELMARPGLVGGGVMPEQVDGYITFPEGTFDFLDRSPLA